MEYALALEKDAPSPNPFKKINNLKGLRCLIVDDIQLNGELAKQHLESLGVECVFEQHSSNVITLLENAVTGKKPFDISVIDYLMPHINGDILAKTIKTTESIRDTVLIMLTSSTRTSYTNCFKDAGFNGYLTKPLKFGELEEMVSFVWDNIMEGNNNIFITVDDFPSRKTGSLGDSALHFKKPSILLAEDNRVNQGLAIEILETAGCIVDVVTNGKQAVSRTNETAFDLILMDCMMPEMDGFEASRTITEKNNSDAPIIALTGNATKDDRERCLESGMSDYLTKPIRKNELLRTIAKWLPDFVDTECHQEKIMFSNYKVLLVEDNRINAAMAEEMLNDLGLLVTIAKNGVEAIEAVQKIKFDLIFMDCMMPIMGGIEATQEIRKLEQNNTIKYCPIVALTANAMASDKKACLDGGIDDFIAKPLKKNVLKSMLGKFLKPTIIKVHKVEEETVKNSFDPDVLKSYKHIMGDKFEHSIKHFIEDFNIMFSKLDSAYRNKNINEIHYIAHTIKSTSATIGAMDLSDIALRLEKETKIQIEKEQDKVILPEHIIDHLKLAFDSTEQHLQKVIH
ncbi:hypothetical protein AB835_07990 [Candidatus Endobugula sertula]|uniref:Histidine kinase n=1 Tax=Candidatus Endobugula sertula TaxID=62101 RepID=A0A1D2QQ37_9GAMM|nr:hypothetical protein AB835_07990 [Candidatus Endobugula sertula]